MKQKTIKNHPPTLLIDGDIIAYKAASATERGFSWDGDNYTSIGSLEEAKKVTEEALLSLLKGFKTNQYIIAMTNKVNWRHQVYPLYKRNRTGKAKPLCLNAIKDYISANHPTYQRPTLEADDILGILSTSETIIKHPGERIIVSVDKDMKSIPGLFYDTKAKELYEISEEEANHYHMMQTLTGDVTDGYPGCRGVGPIKAARILGDKGSYEEWWPLVVKAYEKIGQTEEDALVQARVSRICRAEDYDYKKKEVKLWEVPWSKIA